MTRSSDVHLSKLTMVVDARQISPLCNAASRNVLEESAAAKRCFYAKSLLAGKFTASLLLHFPVGLWERVWQRRETHVC